MAFKKESGIYCITCLKNNKKYIGQSVGLNERMYQHKYYLNKNTSTHPRLQEDWNLYGESNFEIKILESTKDLDERERYWIKYFDSFNSGYNTTTGGIFSNIQDINQRKKRSGSLSGKKNPMYGIAKGETNPNAKLNEKQVKDIKNMIKSGIPDKEIILNLNLTRSQYFKIKHNRTWSHIQI